MSTQQQPRSAPPATISSAQGSTPAATPTPPAFTPRPAQARILAYQEGPMGVSAVPGSGKTFTLSLLAAQLVERLANTDRPAAVQDEHEVLVVTFTNSAVENFRSRISHFLRQRQGLLPGVGYRVRTLHGLAHDIVRERPGLVGLSERFDIVDERTANEIKRDAVLAYLRTHPDLFSPYLHPDFLQNFRRIERYLIEDALDIANLVIRVGKELRVEPFELQARLRHQAGTWPLLEFGLHLYADYQRSLFVRGAVDFDDLIVLALRALEADEDYLFRLQDRWPYILEDEAQDSSALQEEMLRRLTARHGNWVRVGDPNQAINTTFTSANTRFLQEFIARYPAQARDLPNSGRSALPVIELANYLIEWSREQHPHLSQRLALAPPYIEPTAPDDPQPNPAPGEPAVYLFDRALTPEQESEIVIASLKRWLPQHTDKTIAVLVPENSRGFHLTEALQRAGLPYDDSLLRSNSATRAAAQALSVVLSYITQPHVATHLERVWLDVWWPRQVAAIQAQATADEPADNTAALPELKSKVPEPVATFGAALRKLREPETFLFPAQRDWVDSLGWLAEAEGMNTMAEEFRSHLRRWTAATVLPIDELLITLGNDLFTTPADLALTHRLAVLLAKLGQENPNWRLPDLAGELENIAQNRRRILGFTEEGLGFEPKPGQVTVATMHAAKGLEWDRVYLTAVNNFGFPSGNANDKYRSERWYTRDSLNLIAETDAQLRQLHMGTLDDYVPSQATAQARLDLAGERLRLLYVGITRARQELIITYNTGRNPERDPNQPALAFQALHRFVHRS
ncbi:MAG: ATP-dependent helicase [Caldilineaceae bacterium]|nr:ATP-dependent helicase [Caldilineaceae bacterium]